MTTQIMTIAAAVLIGAWLGYQLADKQRIELISELQADTIKQLESAEIKRKEWERISNDYYQKYQTAANREPVTITERVFVRANCPDVSASDGGGMGASGDDAARAELHEEIVRRITEVTHEAEADVLRCRTALKSIITKIEQ